MIFKKNKNKFTIIKFKEEFKRKKISRYTNKINLKKIMIW